MKSICELVQALDGGLVPVVHRGAESFRLGSSYNGRYAAERWADLDWETAISCCSC